MPDKDEQLQAINQQAERLKRRVADSIRSIETACPRCKGYGVVSVQPSKPWRWNGMLCPQCKGTE